MVANREAEQVARALFLCMGLLRRRLRQRPVADVLTFPQMAALSRLDRCGSATSAELARQEQISPQSMGVTIGELEGRGFLSRQPDPTDGRRILLSITASGKRAVNRRRDARVEQLTAGLTGFSAAELAQLAAAAPLIERLAQRL
ncbi:MarR family transcriptional regulator [Mycobacterium sp. BMJ-28]